MGIQYYRAILDSFGFLWLYDFARRTHQAEKVVGGRTTGVHFLQGLVTKWRRGDGEWMLKLLFVAADGKNQTSLIFSAWIEFEQAMLPDAHSPGQITKRHIFLLTFFSILHILIFPKIAVFCGSSHMTFLAEVTIPSCSNPFCLGKTMICLVRSVVLLKSSQNFLV